MIIHFMLDEKIINFLIDNFEGAAPDENVYIIFKSSSDTRLDHVSHKKEVIIFNYLKDDINKVLSDIDSRIIICHILDQIFAKILSRLYQKMTIFWCIWGYDLYSLPLIKPAIYAPHTLKYITITQPLKRLAWLLFRLKHIRSLIFNVRGKGDPFSLTESAHKKVTACLTYIEEDFKLLKNRYPDVTAQFIYFPYLNISQYIGSKIENASVTGNNILIGNSNSLECNHLDAFKLVHEVSGSKIKVIVPLSYSNNEKYKKKLLKTGRELFKENFTPILEFMSLDKYIEILSSCSVGIFYHYRQQAMGNILAMLWLGARVYMSERNPAYLYLKRIGFRIFILDSDFETFLNRPLTDQEIAHNRAIIQSNFASEIVAKNYSDVIKICRSYDT
jgi:dTDP-N-acetylfucosamine:lipid II N-acetylfucosaminyltransferase